MTTYVINGVDGNFGSMAAELILGEVDAADLIVTSWNPSALERWEERGVRTRTANYDDVEQTTEAFRGGDVMLLLSTMAVGPVRQAQHQNAIDAAVAAEIERVVYTSYLGAGDPAADWYTLVDHRYTESAILRSGLGWNFMRDSQYQQAMTQFQAAAAITTGEWRTNCGDGGVSMVHRDDCARSAVALLLGRGERDTAYDITGPELVTFPQVYRKIVELSGASIDYMEISDEEMHTFFQSMGVPRYATDDFTSSPFPWCSEDMVTNGAGIRRGGMAVISSAVEELTGRKPQSIWDTIVTDAAHWPAPVR